MTLGQRIRELRRARQLTLRKLAMQVDCTFTYLSKIENGKLDLSNFPSEKLICRIAHVLGGDKDELLLLAEKVPTFIRNRVLERPEAFRKLAALDDASLDQVISTLDFNETNSKTG